MKTTGERIYAHHRRTAERGRRSIGPIPFGYEIDSARQRRRFGVAIKPSVMAPVVVRIFESYLEGKSIASVVCHLARERIWSPRGQDWTRGSIAFVLKNQIYIGVVEVDGVVRRGDHEPIVNVGTFRRVQALLKKNVRNGRRPCPK